MPRPIAPSLVSTPLTNLSIAQWQQDRSKYIADQVFPTVPVENDVGIYYTYDPGDAARIETAPHAEGGVAVERGYKLASSTFRCSSDGLRMKITDQDRRRAGNAGLDLDFSATNTLTDDVLRARDRKWANTFFTTGVWSTDLTGVSGTPSTGQFKQFDQSSSTPIKDLRTAARKMQPLLNGRYPNFMVVERNVWEILLDSADIIERVKYVERALPGAIEGAMAELFGVDKVLVADTWTNTAPEDATKTLAPLFSRGILFLWAAPSPGLGILTGGAIFSWSEFDQAKNGGATIYKYREDARRSDWIQADMYNDMRVIAPDAGVFMSAAVGTSA